MGIRVWGNYCGPGWTGGSNVGPGVRGNFSVITTDALDAQCRLHARVERLKPEGRNLGNAALAYD